MKQNVFKLTVMVAILFAGSLVAYGHGKPDVEWPDLHELDAQTRDYESLLQTESIDALRADASLLKLQAMKVARQKPPRKVRNPLVIRVLQEEMLRLTQSFRDPTSGSVAHIRSAVSQLHTLVRDMMHESGMGHEHLHQDHGVGPHEGLLASFTSSDGDTAGFLELKLHDDKGDLELWLACDRYMVHPMDLPLDARISVTFVDKDNQGVELGIRNAQRNEDEDGRPNVREGKTNYFVYPVSPGVDTNWLKGASFRSRVVVAFSLDGKVMTSETFTLRPHSHDGHGIFE